MAIAGGQHTGVDEHERNSRNKAKPTPTLGLAFFVVHPAWASSLGNNASGPNTILAPKRRAANFSRGGWVPFEYEFTLPAGVIQVRFTVILDPTFKPGEIIYFDDVEIYKAAN